MDVPDDIAAALRRMGLVPGGAALHGVPLAGGVSSDIWRVDLPERPVCVKRALPRLRVAADWRAPVERNAYECEWMRVASAIVPGITPQILGRDAATGSFAMAFLDPATHPLWKSQLRDGIARPETADAVAARLVGVHAATAGDDAVARRFRTGDLFAALRLDPYLRTTAVAHPAVAAELEDLAERTSATAVALVHGDVSPKNILVGPDGPVLLDAECAWFGEPAFDVAFCLTHLLLKSVWKPAHTTAYLACYHAFAARYRAGVDWDDPAAVEGRAAALLPGLLLARIDGKSPVEYITEEDDRQRVRRVTLALLRRPAATLGEVAARW